MSSVSQIETCIERLFGERANELARETGYIQRQREFTGASLARTFIFGWMENEQMTLERFTQIAQYSQVAVSDTAIHKRFSKQGAEVLMRQRWHIERLFHRWKDGSQIDEWRTSKPCAWSVSCTAS